MYGTALTEHKEAVNPHNIAPETIGLGTVKTDITLLQKEIKDTSKNDCRSQSQWRATTVSGINLSLPKNVTQGGGKVTVKGNTLTDVTGWAEIQAVLASGKRSAVFPCRTRTWRNKNKFRSNHIQSTRTQSS